VAVPEHEHRCNAHEWFRVVYAIAQGGTLLGHIFLNQAIGAAYTPLSLGPDGTIYTENDGILLAVGR